MKDFNKLLAISLLLLSLINAKAEDNKLKYNGMPVGGIGSGQVNLGGDGQLWYWDVFNIQ
uniref:hypothetical protein n=1 Tax=uncultured Draconibacterium sp. TaxID=1573823 RepID=UPI003217316C